MVSAWLDFIPRDLTLYGIILVLCWYGFRSFRRNSPHAYEDSTFLSKVQIATMEECVIEGAIENIIACEGSVPFEHLVLKRENSWGRHVRNRRPFRISGSVPDLHDISSESSSPIFGDRNGDLRKILKGEPGDPNVEINRTICNKSVDKRDYFTDSVEIETPVGTNSKLLNIEVTSALSYKLFI